MHSLEILHDLPAGYFVEESPGGVLALHADVARAFHELGFGPERDGTLSPSDLSGRRPLEELVAGNERFALRRFHHGGLLRWFTNDRFRDPERPFRELIVSDALRKSGLRTPQVVAARARLARGGGWFLELVTRRMEDAVDLGEVLEALGGMEPARRHALLRAAGALVRNLHRVGLYHADLQPKNVLVRWDHPGPGECELWILDLDRSVFFETLSRGQRRRNLRRLYRAVVRRSQGGRSPLGRTDIVRFLLAYRPEGGSWKEDWRRIATVHRRRSAAHAAGWWIEHVFGGRTAAPSAR